MVGGCEVVGTAGRRTTGVRVEAWGAVELAAAMEEEAVVLRWGCLGKWGLLAGAGPWEHSTRSHWATKSIKWSSVGVCRRPGSPLYQRS